MVNKPFKIILIIILILGFLAALYIYLAFRHMGEGFVHGKPAGF